MQENNNFIDRLNLCYKNLSRKERGQRRKEIKRNLWKGTIIGVTWYLFIIYLAFLILSIALLLIYFKIENKTRATELMLDFAVGIISAILLAYFIDYANEKFKRYKIAASINNYVYMIYSTLYNFVEHDFHIDDLKKIDFTSGESALGAKIILTEQKQDTIKLLENITNYINECFSKFAMYLGEKLNANLTILNTQVRIMKSNLELEVMQGKLMLVALEGIQEKLKNEYCTDEKIQDALFLYFSFHNLFSKALPD